MVKVSLGGMLIERVRIDDDSYTGTIEKVSDVYDTTDYNGKAIEKVCFDIRVQTEKHGKVLLPLFMSAVVSDAGESNAKYRNSRLFDLLKLAGKIEDFSKLQPELVASGLNEEASNMSFASFLRKVFMGKQVKLLTKTAQPEQGDPYSIVSEVLKFPEDTDDAKEGTLEEDSAVVEECVEKEG